MSVPSNFCTQCGAPLNPEARFCGSCGAPTEVDGPSPAQPQYAPPAAPVQPQYAPPAAPAPPPYAAPAPPPYAAPAPPMPKPVSPLWSIGGLVLCGMAILIVVGSVLSSDDVSSAASGAGILNLIALALAVRGMKSSLRALSIIVLAINLLGLIAAAVLIFAGV